MVSEKLVQIDFKIWRDIGRESKPKIDEKMGNTASNKKNNGEKEDR